MTVPKSSEKTIVYSQRASPPNGAALQSIAPTNVRVAASQLGDAKRLTAGGRVPSSSRQSGGAASYEM